MPSEYLLLAKSHLDYVQAKRAGLSGEQTCAKMMEEAVLAVQIAQVEATERLAAAMVGVPLLDEPLPFEDGQRTCVHGVAMCEPCEAVADIGACVHGGHDDGCEACTESGLVLRRGYDTNGRLMYTEAGPPHAG